MKLRKKTNVPPASDGTHASVVGKIPVPISKRRLVAIVFVAALITASLGVLYWQHYRAGNSNRPAEVPAKFQDSHGGVFAPRDRVDIDAPAVDIKDVVNVPQ